MRPMLSWEQLAEISASGIECGTHSHSHPQLDVIPISEARNEIFQCKQIVEDNLKQKVSSFAYPFGYYNAAVRQIVKEAGYTSACAVKYLISSTADDPFTLSRFIVTPDMSIDRFANLLTSRRTPVALMSRRVRDTASQFIRHRNAQTMR
jgi:peptidoglycan/xylan/chitin deacetylase (PgdA/CDA1 family)